MKSLFSFGSFVLLSLSLLLGCSGGSGEGKAGNPDQPAPKLRVNWNSIPSEFNPSVDELNFNGADFERIKLNIVGFDNDVEVVYSDSMTAGAVSVRVYKVWKKNASFGNISTKSSGKNLDIYNTGSYACSIKINNGNITELEGGCYIRLQILLPTNAQIEVYNVGKLITKRFIPIDNATFLKDFSNAIRTDDKFMVIEDFVKSYEASGKTPSITSDELGKVIKDFIRKEDKLTVLRRLHVFTSDRQNLSGMIDDVFSYFDRDEAKRVAGL